MVNTGLAYKQVIRVIPAPFVLCAICVIAAQGVMGLALAQNYPVKPVRLVIGFPPGGGADIMARILAPKMVEALGQQVIIESRPGAGTNIAMDYVVKSPPDGYTLLMNTPPIAINMSLYKNLGFDTMRDLAAVSVFASTPNVLTVHPSLPARTPKDLLALAKSKPGALTYASSGNLGGPHLAGELINLMGGVKILHVPYKGNGPAAIALLTGESTMMFGSGPSVIPHVNNGKLRALATTGKKRTIPELPAMTELLPGYEVTQWYGILVPAGVPKEIVDRLNKEMARAIANPKIAGMFIKLGTQPVSTSSEEFAAFIKSEQMKYAKVIKEAGIRVD